MSTRKQLSIGAESAFGFGNLAPGSPVPDRAALDPLLGGNAAAVLCDRANIESVGEAAIAQREVTRSAYTVDTPRPISIFNDDPAELVYYQRRMGSIQAVMSAQTVGAGTTNIPDNSLLPMAQMLNTVMQDQGDPAGTAGVSFGGATTDPNPITAVVGQVLTLTSVGGLEVGEVLSVVIDGVTEYTRITYINLNDVTINPGLSRVAVAGAPGVPGDTFYRMRQYYVPAGLITPGDSLAARLEGDLWRDEANGLRASGITISQDQGELIVDVTMEAPYVASYHDDADVSGGTNVVEPNDPAGPGSQLLGARQVVGFTPSNDPSLDATVTPGAEMASVAMDVDDLTVTITVGLEKRGKTDNILACSDQEIVDFNVEVSVTLSTPLSTFEEDLLKKQNRMLLFGAGRAGEGTGFCICIPSAALLNSPQLRDMSTDLVRQTLTFGLERPFLDDTTGAASGLPGSIFGIALGVQGA